MARYRPFIYFLFFVITFTSILADRVHFEEERQRWNTPPELVPVGSERNENENNSDNPQARFLPFTASFTLNTGANNAHSLSVGGSDEGISLSQSQSSSSSFFENSRPGISASQSTSFSAGLAGISASDANSLSLNHPIFGRDGGNSANSNSYSWGEANSSSAGKVVNNQAITSAQSSVGSSSNSVSSGASSSAGNFASSASNAGTSANRDHSSWNIHPNYQNQHFNNPYTRPQETTSNFPQKWEQKLPEPSSNRYWSQNHQQNQQNPSLQISGVSASSSASSSANGHSFGQSSAGSSSGDNGKPSSWAHNRVESSGNAQSLAQGNAATVQQTSDKVDGSFSSGAISASSVDNGHALGTSISDNRGHYNRGQVTGQSAGNSDIRGTANAGTVSLIKFPDNSAPREFIQSRFEGNANNNDNSGQLMRRRPKMKRRNPVDRFLTDITDTVVDLFDI
ncbi:serine-rich adhesin for platelets-like [Microplitis mediator]|uniref:serine-rich adhesin for platelets-like n=1 Tax=Microplitis mediator TaxID=375433 RepID=UPI002555C31F|nr:serine-rich adhesin for platelets-like [Microplitis mediator]